MPTTDVTLACVDCKGSFVFTKKDAEFFASKGFQTPKRCHDCRKKKKARFDSYDNQKQHGTGEPSI